MRWLTISSKDPTITIKMISSGMMKFGLQIQVIKDKTKIPNARDPTVYVKYISKVENEKYCLR